jgi:hypothetical protein
LHGKDAVGLLAEAQDGQRAARAEVAGDVAVDGRKLGGLEGGHPELAQVRAPGGLEQRPLHRCLARDRRGRGTGQRRQGLDRQAERDCERSRVGARIRRGCCCGIERRRRRPEVDAGGAVREIVRRGPRSDDPCTVADAVVRDQLTEQRCRRLRVQRDCDADHGHVEDARRPAQVDIEGQAGVHGRREVGHPGHAALKAALLVEQIGGVAAPLHADLDLVEHRSALHHDRAAGRGPNPCDEEVGHSASYGRPRRPGWAQGEVWGRAGGTGLRLLADPGRAVGAHRRGEEVPSPVERVVAAGHHRRPVRLSRRKLPVVEQRLVVIDVHVVREDPDEEVAVTDAGLEAHR